MEIQTKGNSFQLLGAQGAVRRDYKEEIVKAVAFEIFKEAFGLSKMGKIQMGIKACKVQRE